VRDGDERRLQGKRSDWRLEMVFDRMLSVEALRSLRSHGWQDRGTDDLRYLRYLRWIEVEAGWCFRCPMIRGNIPGCSVM
jgi:hypothetical protein